MSTTKQWVFGKIKGLKAKISPNRGKLLLTTVVLFCLIGVAAAPTRSVEHLIKANPLNQEAVKNPSQAREINNDFCFTNNFLSSREATNPSQTDSRTLASLASQEQEAANQLDDETPLAMFNHSSLLNKNNPITLTSQKPRNEIISYTVQSGDMPSTIAASFGLSLNTLLWANELNDGSIIRPGDELTILPIDGLTHRVKNGETVGAIATKYRANTEKIIAFNDLPADGSIQIGQKLIIPDGQMPTPSQPKPSYVAQSYVVGDGAGKSRAFPYGQCTWYVAQKRYVPWSGHAKSWLVNAQAYGFSTGSIPQPGAIMVMQGGNWLGRVYGHVAYVESVSGDWVTISEMNHIGWAIKSVRAIHRNSSLIKGYIY